MALVNEILVGRYNRFVQKLLSMKGPAALVQVRGEMGVEIPLFHGVENRYLEGWDRFANDTQIGSGAAATAGKFRNPTGSNVIAVVEKIVMGNPTATITVEIQAAADTTDYGATSTGNSMDTRGRKASTLLFSSSAGAGANLTTPASIKYTMLVNQNVDGILTVGQEWTVLPGMSIQAIGSAAAGFTFGMMWRERFLEDSERA